MKKLLFILLLLPFFGLSQTTGYLRYDSVKIMKQNGNSNLIIENATRGLTNSFLQNYSEGRTKFAYALDSVWQDGDSIRFRYGTTTIAVPATGGSISPTACNEIIEPGAVVYTGTGLNFYITPATYRIDCIEYTSDSVSFTLDPADGTFDRFDRFYLDATGAHVVTGTPAESPLIPQLPSSSLDLTSVQIDAGATTPDLVTSIVYDENTESVVTNFGTTTDGGQTTTVYKGTFATEVTNIVNGEYIEFTKTSGAWDVSTMDQFSLFFRLKQILGAATYIKVSLWNGTTLLSNEVAIGFNKNAVNQWQGAAFPMSLFGNITNTLVTKVRFRYQTSTGATHPGFFFDWITFVDGLSSPGPGGNINLTLNMPPAFTVSPFNTVVNNGVWNVTMPGTQGQYLRGDGTVGTKDWITKIGAVDNYDRVPNGMQISGDTLYGQTADTTNVGFLGAYDWRRFDSTARMTVENVGDGDSVMVNLDAFRTAFKTLKEGTGVTFDITDTTITVNSSGGGGSALIPTNGTGTATGDMTGDAGTHNLAITGDGTTAATTIKRTTDEGGGTIRDQEIVIAIDGTTRIDTRRTGSSSASIVNTGGTIGLHTYDSTTSTHGLIGINPDLIEFDTPNGVYTFTNLADSIADDDNYSLVWNNVTNQIYKAPLGSGGGGGGTPGIDSVLAQNQTITTDRYVNMSDKQVTWSATNPGVDSVVQRHDADRWETMWSNHTNRLSGLHISVNLVQLQSFNGVDNEGGRFSINGAIGGGGALYEDYGAVPTGIQYNADYSATYTNRSLVDKEYVDTLFASGGGGGAANLLFDSLGAAGVSPVTVRDDTLMSRRISVTGGLAIDTTATGGIVIGGQTRWIPRVGSTTSSATPTINTDNVDIYKLTAQAADITSFTTNLTGTPNDGDILELQITGTATRNITWGASFVSSTVTLPAATDGTNTLTVILQYYTTSSYGNNVWVCVNFF